MILNEVFKKASAFALIGGAITAIIPNSWFAAAILTAEYAPAAPGIACAALAGGSLHRIFNTESGTARRNLSYAALATGTAGVLANAYSMEMLVPLASGMEGFGQAMTGLMGSFAAIPATGLLNLLSHSPD